VLWEFGERLVLAAAGAPDIVDSKVTELGPEAACVAARLLCESARLVGVKEAVACLLGLVCNATLPHAATPIAVAAIVCSIERADQVGSATLLSVREGLGVGMSRLCAEDGEREDPDGPRQMALLSALVLSAHHARGVVGGAVGGWLESLALRPGVRTAVVETGLFSATLAASGTSASKAKRIGASGSTAQGEAIAVLLEALGRCGLDGWCRERREGEEDWNVGVEVGWMLQLLCRLGASPCDPDGTLARREDLPPLSPSALVGMGVAAAAGCASREMYGVGNSGWTAWGPLSAARVWAIACPALARVLDWASSVTDDISLQGCDREVVTRACSDLAVRLLLRCARSSLTLLRRPPPGIEHLPALLEAAARRDANVPGPKSASTGFAPSEFIVLRSLLTRVTMLCAHTDEAVAETVAAFERMAPRARIYLCRAVLSLSPHAHEAMAMLDLCRRMVVEAQRGGEGVALRSAQRGGVAALLGDFAGARIASIATALDDARGEGGSSGLAAAAPVIVSLLQLLRLLLLMEPRLAAATPELLSTRESRLGRQVLTLLGALRRSARAELERLRAEAREGAASSVLEGLSAPPEVVAASSRPIRAINVSVSAPSQEEARLLHLLVHAAETFQEAYSPAATAT
jgi:hypothetical protein